MNWVSSNKALPPEQTLVLVLGGFSYMLSGIWYTIDGNPVHWAVTHWMPITPPK